MMQEMLTSPRDRPGPMSTVSLMALESTLLVAVSADLVWVDSPLAVASPGKCLRPLVVVCGTGYLAFGVSDLTRCLPTNRKTNQYGLTCDTVRSFNVLLPNGTATVASATQNPDLFFALKGGMNKFGVVTSAVFETHPQTDKVWGGLTIYTGDKAVNQVLNATTHFSFNNKDPKAQIITTMEASATGNSVFLLQFYDGPEKPAAFDIFDELVDAIPVLKTTRSQSFKSFINGFPSPLKQLTNWRGAFITISTSQLTPNFLEAIRVEAEAIGKEMIANGGNTASFDIEPFTNYGQFATESAYPHADSPMPLNLYFAWFNKSDDEFWYNRMKQSVATLKAVAEADGIFSPTFTIYPNYALFDTPAAELYGTVNAARLRAIRAQVDPTGIMDLAGGFQI